MHILWGRKWKEAHDGDKEGRRGKVREGNGGWEDEGKGGWKKGEEEWRRGQYLNDVLIGAPFCY